MIIVYIKNIFIFTTTNKNTNTMKTQINKSFKSKVMKAAWKIYKEDSANNFSDALIAAWKWAKKNLVEKFTKIGEIVKETEKAIYAVIGMSMRYDHVSEEMVCSVKKIWIPKSIIIDGSVPEWFMKKNNI